MQAASTEVQDSFSLGGNKVYLILYNNNNKTCNCTLDFNCSSDWNFTMCPVDFLVSYFSC